MYKGYLIFAVIYYTFFTFLLGLFEWIEWSDEIQALNEWQPGTVLLTFTYWNFVLQYIFYVIEILNLYQIVSVTRETREIFLNIIFSPSVSILVYWILVYSLEWGFLMPWYIDISIHGINILMLIGMVLFKYPCIAQLNTIQNIVFPFLVPVIYAIVTSIYTYITMKLIYPSNLMSFQTIDDNPPYGWVSILFLCVAIPLPQFIFYFICKAVSTQRGTRNLRNIKNPGNLSNM
jgi:hypothetical protein